MDITLYANTLGSRLLPQIRYYLWNQAIERKTQVVSSCVKIDNILGSIFSHEKMSVFVYEQKKRITYQLLLIGFKSLREFLAKSS